MRVSQTFFIKPPYEEIKKAMAPFNKISQETSLRLFFCSSSPTPKWWCLSFKLCPYGPFTIHPLFCSLLPLNFLKWPTLETFTHINAILASKFWIFLLLLFVLIVFYFQEETIGELQRMRIGLSGGKGEILLHVRREKALRGRLMTS